MILSRVHKVSRRLGLPWYRAMPVESFVRLYRHPFFRTLSRPLFPARKPLGVLFVVGCYNAGTTVVKDAIALHPDVAIAPIEGIRLTDTLSDLQKGGWPRGLYGNRAEVLRTRCHGEVDAKRLLSDLRPWIREGRYFLEKSIANSVRIPLLRRAFPGTRFVCVVRRCDSVVSGIRRRSRPTGVARRILDTDEYPNGFLARQWRFFYSMVLADMETDPTDIMLCSYERFIADPAGELARLFDFLGLRSQTVTLDGRTLRVGNRALIVHDNHESGQADGCGHLDTAEKLRACIEEPA